MNTLLVVASLRCNRRCPDCLCKPMLGTWDYPVDALTEHLRVLGDFKRIHLTGGEAILHRRFPDVAAACAKHCEMLTITTNGQCGRVDDYALCGMVRITRYPDNEDRADKLARELRDRGIAVKLAETNVSHVKSAPGAGSPCFREGSFTLYDGRLYGCCVAWTFGEYAGTPTLRADETPELPCARCRFSGERDQ